MLINILVTFPTNGRRGVGLSETVFELGGAPVADRRVAADSVVQPRDRRPTVPSPVRSITPGIPGSADG